MGAAQIGIHALRQFGLGEVASQQYPGGHFRIPEIILTPIEVTPIPHSL